MSYPFNLYYGDHVNVKIMGTDAEEVNTYTSELGTSEGTLIPFITDQLEFGYNEYNYFPFDQLHGKYPTKEEMATLDFTDEWKLNMIRIEERHTEDDTQRLHGIQLGFSNGVETPFFKGKETGQEMTLHEIPVDPTIEIRGVQMKMWKDNLTGIRLLNPEWEHFVDYTWEEGE